MAKKKSNAVAKKHDDQAARDAAMGLNPFIGGDYKITSARTAAALSFIGHAINIQDSHSQEMAYGADLLIRTLINALDFESGDALFFANSTLGGAA